MGTVTIFDVSDNGVRRTAEIPTNQLLSAATLVRNSVAKGLNVCETYWAIGFDGFTVRYRVGSPVVVLTVETDAIVFEFALAVDEAADEIEGLTR